MTNKMLALDMDGTFVNLYGVDGWLDMIRAEDTTPYEVAQPIYDMDELNSLLNSLRAIGYRITVISWCAKNATKAYDKAVRAAKRNWLKAHNVPVDEIHIVKYGTPKAYTVKGEAILADDEEPNRKAWYRGETIDATKNLLEELRKLV